MSKTAPPLAPPTEEQLAEAEDFKQTSDFANYFCTYAFIYHQKQMLEDLLTAAFNDARAKADAVSGTEMSKMTSGLQLPPGFKLPF